MDTFERVRKWLAKELDLREALITPQSTLRDLLPPARKTDAGGIEWALVVDFEREFRGSNGEYLTPSMTVHEMVERVARSGKLEQDSEADRYRRHYIAADHMPAPARR